MKKTAFRLFGLLFALFAVGSSVGLEAFNVPSTGLHVHWLDSFSDRDVLRMEDGSEWRAATPAETVTVYNWNRGDRILICQNSGFLSSSSYYPFYLNNIDKKSYIRVSPVAGPVEFAEHALWVQGVDPLLGYVTLVHGSGRLNTWEVCKSDLRQACMWEGNDHIVVGVYDSLFPCLCSYNYILINFSKANFVQARPH